VVNPEKVKKEGEACEALVPPLEAVLLEGVPVVDREAPVLSVVRERVGRSAGLLLEAEILRVSPNFDTEAVYADGQVAFEEDAFGTRIVGGIKELLMEGEL
jgi:hypothetical protein